MSTATTRTPSVSCVFVCHDGDGRILMARRSAGARDEPGTWDCGAGGIEYGETFEEAVGREVGEEYATNVLELETIGVRNILRGDPVSHWIAIIFAVRVNPDTVRIGEPHKFDELGWFYPGDLPSPLHSQLNDTLALFKRWQQARE
jgi:8-oxo-dGTP pyrophosphatase MutT (NUDIX family)